jgi:hypothetical protein
MCRRQHANDACNRGTAGNFFNSLRIELSSIFNHKKLIQIFEMALNTASHHNPIHVFVSYFLCPILYFSLSINIKMKINFIFLCAFLCIFFEHTHMKYYFFLQFSFISFFNSYTYTCFPTFCVYISFISV